MNFQKILKKFFDSTPLDGCFERFIGNRRCSRPEVFFEISQNSQKNSSATVSFLKNKTWNRCFPVNFAKFLRTSFVKEQFLWLPLKPLLFLAEIKYSVEHSCFCYSKVYSVKLKRTFLNKVF